MPSGSLGLLRLGITDEATGNVECGQPRTPLGDDAGIVTFTATHVEAPQSGHIGKHIHEGRGVDVVAVLVIAEASERGPSLGVCVPEFADRAVVQGILVLRSHT